MSAAVLFTCAGQRVDIVSAFARAGATSIAVDANALASALYHADHRVLAADRRSGYLDALRRSSPSTTSTSSSRSPTSTSTCSPRSATRSARSSCSELEVVEAMADKWLSHRFFLERVLVARHVAPGRGAGDSPGSCCS